MLIICKSELILVTVLDILFVATIVKFASHQRIDGEMTLCVERVLIKMDKSRGDSTLPCGNPASIWHTDESFPATLILCLRL